MPAQHSLSAEQGLPAQQELPAQHGLSAQQDLPAHQGMPAQQQDEQQPPAYKRRTLVAFDFDHTIVDGNSDTWVYRSLPAQELPMRVRRGYVEGQWTAFMNSVFGHLAEEGVMEGPMRQCMAEMPLVPGMQELLRHLASRPDLFECVIVSDSNTLFIEWIMQAQGLGDVFSHVFTNEALWEKQGGRLSIRPHHSHGCTTCHANLCKREVLQGLIDRQYNSNGLQYDRLLYVGDGSNDLCPAAMLAEGGDAVFPRIGFPLHQALLAQQQKMQQQQQQQQPPGAGPAGVGMAAEPARSGGCSRGVAASATEPEGAASAATGPKGVAAAATALWLHGPGVRVAPGLRGLAGAHESAGGRDDEDRSLVRAQVVAWDSGFQLLEWIQRNFQREGATG